MSRGWSPSRCFSKVAALMCAPVGSREGKRCSIPETLALLIVYTTAGVHSAMAFLLNLMWERPDLSQRPLYHLSRPLPH